jgi:hypothetical protein
MSHITTRTCAASASLVQRVLFVIKRLYGILLILVDKEPASPWHVENSAGRAPEKADRCETNF